jgi:hypothetical protein
MLINVGIRSFADDPTLDFSQDFTQFVALLDTGATRTAISRNVINRVQLRSRGMMPVGNVRRTEDHHTYMFYVAIWPEASDGSISPPFGIGEAILGIDGGDSRYYDVLLGMDIISRGSLRLEANGQFELSFPDKF